MAKQTLLKMCGIPVNKDLVKGKYGTWIFTHTDLKVIEGSTSPDIIGQKLRLAPYNLLNPKEVVQN
jgi:hypothetical protein